MWGWIMRRYELSQRQFDLISELLPENGHRGGQWKDHRTILNAIFWRLRSGSQWREIPERYGPWQTVYERFCRWRDDGTLDRILACLQLKLNDEGLLDPDLWLVDGSNIRASRSAAGATEKKNRPLEPEDHALGYSRGGFGTKIHLVADSNGTPLAFELSAGEAHESKYLESVLEKVNIPSSTAGRRRRRPNSLACDKGYSAPRIREYLKGRGIRVVIPKRSNEKYRRKDFDSKTYKKRNAVERCFGWMKENRAVETRFEKLAVSFEADIKFAFIQRYVRLIDSSDTT